MLDEHRAALPADADNLVAHLMALERSPSPQATRRSIMHLHRHLKAARHDSLRRAFTVYIQRVLLRRLVPGETIPEVNDLQEMDAMLADRVVEWTEKWKQDGMKAGFEQGLSKGLEQGLNQGRQQGMQQGMQQGLQTGLNQGLLDGRRRLLVAQLAARFGQPLPVDAAERIATAGEASLDAWGVALLTASTLAAVFDAHP